MNAIQYFLLSMVLVWLLEFEVGVVDKELRH